MTLNFIGLAASTYYEYQKREIQDATFDNPFKTRDYQTAKVGRPVSGYSFNQKGDKISDEQIKEYLCELITGDGFPYGYRKLKAALVDDYGIIINNKKVYRLCRELQILQPQRIKKNKHPRRLARMDKVSGPNQLWEMDIKYGYIAGTDSFFYQLSLIDVFNRIVIAYHLGLSCTAINACLIIQEALRKNYLSKGMLMPKIRTDNGPQFIADKFESLCESLNIVHERIPIKTPNMNAHIESFHSILEKECYQRNEFSSFLDVYSTVTEYMRYYNERRRHGSLNYMAPKLFHTVFLSNSIKVEPFSA